MPSIRESIARYLAELQRSGASRHTIRNYGSDLSQFAEYFELSADVPPVEELDLLALREWLAHIYGEKLQTVSIRRKVSCIRAWFTFLRTEGVLATNVAARLRTPKAKHRLPDVMSSEKTNHLLDASADLAPVRDRAILEVLYGCGIRVSELVGLSISDVDWEGCWIRVLGKGNKERQVPVTRSAVEALQRYQAERNSSSDALFLNAHGRRMGDRDVRRIVKQWALLTTGDSTVHPHSFRHAYATHLLTEGADLRAIQELLGHAKLSTTQKYTQVTLKGLQAVYNRAHPKA